MLTNAAGQVEYGKRKAEGCRGLVSGVFAHGSESQTPTVAIEIPTVTLSVLQSATEGAA